MKKSWRLTGLVSAIILGLGGIGFGVYAVYELQTLTRSVDQIITYTPGLLEIFSAKYYVNGANGKGIDFNQNSGTQASPGEITFTGAGFIVYEFDFKMNAKYESVKCNIYITTASEGLKFGYCADSAGSELSSVEYTAREEKLINTTTVSEGDSSKTLYIYVKLDEADLPPGARLSYSIKAVFTEVEAAA